jgi:protein-S-isoprenylcysteine O-methyltransferase Ste14
MFCEQDFVGSAMTARNYARLAAAIFAIVAVLQLGRAAAGLPLTVGTTSIPLWASWIACVVAFVLAWLGFNASRA